MADKSENLVLEGLTIASNVVETIVRLAAQEVPGVEVGAPAPRRLVPATKPVEVVVDAEGRLEIGVHVKLAYGLKLHATADLIQRAVVDALTVQVGVAPAAVNVFIDALEFEK